MREVKAKIFSAPKRYLDWVGFSIREKQAKFVKRLWGDGLAAVAFSGISIFLICSQQADKIVLMLNTFCLFRAMISNTISASQVTLRNDETDIVKENRKYVYYHIKATALIVSFIFIVIALVVLWSDKESNAGSLVKSFSILAIGAVLFNDLENDFVCAYDAIINPI